MTSGAPIHVHSLDHVTLIVDDLKRSRDFYVGLIGMQDAERPAFRFPGLWFQAGATLIHLIETHEQSGPAGYPDQVVRSNTRNHHIAFLVDDAAAAAGILKERGYPLVSEAKERPDGAIQVFVQDPDGHLVELCSNPC